MEEVSEMDTTELLNEDESMSAEEEVEGGEGMNKAERMSQLWNQADAIDQKLSLMQDVVERRLNNSPSKMREREAEMVSIAGDGEDDQSEISSVDWNWNLQRELEMETTVSIGGGSDDGLSSGGHESEVESNLDEEIEEDELYVEDHKDLGAKTMRDLKDPYFQHSLEMVGLVRARSSATDSSLKQVCFGPQCWQCYEWAPLWTCEKCEKNFHGKCASYGEGYPDPVLVKVNRKGPDGQGEDVIMTECTECQIAEVTAMPTLKDVPIENPISHRTQGKLWPNIGIFPGPYSVLAICPSICQSKFHSDHGPFIAQQ